MVLWTACGPWAIGCAPLLYMVHKLVAPRLLCVMTRLLVNLFQNFRTLPFIWNLCTCCRKNCIQIWDRFFYPRKFCHMDLYQRASLCLCSLSGILHRGHDLGEKPYTAPFSDVSEHLPLSRGVWFPGAWCYYFCPFNMTERCAQIRTRSRLPGVLAQQSNGPLRTAAGWYAFSCCSICIQNICWSSIIKAGFYLRIDNRSVLSSWGRHVAPFRERGQLGLVVRHKYPCELSALC